MHHKMIMVAPGELEAEELQAQRAYASGPKDVSAELKDTAQAEADQRQAAVEAEAQRRRSASEGPRGARRATSARPADLTGSHDQAVRGQRTASFLDRHPSGKPRSVT
jgi:hypothetical protein